MEKKDPSLAGNFRVRPNGDGSVELELGRVSLQTGSHESFEVERDTTYDGQGTHYRVSASASDWLRSGVSFDGYGYDSKSGQDSRASFEVILPPPYRMDPAVVNPYDPAAMPTGTRMRFDTAQQANQESTLGLKYVEFIDEASQKQGYSVQIEKTGANTVRVVAGPNSEFERYGALGIPLDVVTPEFGRRDTLAGASLRSAEFDLSTPEGRLAYGRFMGEGTFPGRNGPGVSNVSTEDRIASESQPGIKVPVPGMDDALELKLEGSHGDGSVTRHDDGSVVVRNARRYDSGVPLVEEERIDAQGNSAKTYTFEFTPDNSAIATHLNQAFSEDPANPAKDLFKAGQSTTVTFTREQMQELWDMARQASRNNPMAGELASFLQDVRSPDDLAERMMRRWNGQNGTFGVPTLLSTIAENVDRERGFDRLPGSIPAAGQPQRSGGADAPPGPVASGVPSLTSDRHADHPLFAAIRDKAPADIGDDHLALATRQAKGVGITATNLYMVLRGPNNPDDLWVTGSPPASLRTSVDLSQPAPGIDRTSAELAAQTRDAAQSQEAQLQEQQRAAQARS